MYRSSRAVLYGTIFRIFCGLVLLFSCVTKYQQPLAPADYQKDMGIGFSVDWFKSAYLGSETPEPQDSEEVPEAQYTAKSLKETMSDLYQAGFRNLRIRSRADIWGFADIADDIADDVAGEPHILRQEIDSDSVNKYLGELDRVLDGAFDNSLGQGLFVTISWIHHPAEGRADTIDGDNYVAWWRTVAKHTRNRDYRLSYNLMTEVGQQDPDGDGINGLYDSPETWNDWTRRAIAAIRKTGGNNAKRNIIITAPRNTKADSLGDIDKDILAEDFLLLEYHSYAAGPKHTGRNAWQGDGRPEDRLRLTDRLDALEQFTSRTGIPVYWGAWMPMTNNQSIKAKLDAAESLAFAEFFTVELARRGIPWSMNKLRKYYDPLHNTWNKDFTDFRGLTISNIENIIAVILGVS